MKSTECKGVGSLLLFICAAATTFMACGGSGSSLPTSESLDSGARIEGMVESAGDAVGTDASGGSEVRATSGSAGIKVSAVGTAQSTTTDAAGGFTLAGLPAGSAMLRFEASAINATVQVRGLAVGQTLRIAFRVLGPTTIATGPLPPTVPPNPGPGQPPPQGLCFSAGAKAEIEGLIVEKEGASSGFIGSVTVAQQGKGNFLCEVSSATRIRKGNRELTLNDLGLGSRVHVSGTGMTATTVCRVEAVEIKLQN